MVYVCAAIYDCLYEPLPVVQQKQESEECHQALIAALDKPERRLVLQIIDAKDQIAEDRFIDSFIAGFRLAWQLSNELNMYEKTRPMPRPREKGTSIDAFIADEN